MPDLNDLLACFPEAAVLIQGDRIAAANPMARHYLPQLEPGAPVPSWFPPLSEEAPRSGVFTAGLSRYAFRLAGTSGGLWLTFQPAPLTALTDTQLDGALRQLRTFLGELLVGSEELSGPGHPELKKSFHRLFRLVDNLDFMRLAGSGDGVPFRPVTMDLAGLCRQTCAEAAPLLRDAGVELDYQSPLSSLLVPGDPQLLRRLLLELIANAARAPGQDRIEVRLRSQGGRAVLTLSGNGAPPTQRQLAAMLQQDTDQRLPMAGSGAGLGLPIARHIASLHQGSLLVDLGQEAPTTILSLPTGPLDPRVPVRSPILQQDGGLSPLLVALSDVLPAGLFALDDDS
ncbi:sensor histidine kinase [Pseudoflavonifractor phocaeensis]|uniref:sensor histidine kinase n=1 Tax=Pseudoflavonifractor phocaeensis TaxID=1870988 RepID=UPI001F429C34|nr:HAMP domain-containing sensor histidine kinase [Pseudoflavonifractor phocaeensis]MCF2662105.1 HAMP domain-containing histidine kinase [Pseudoflavonifractor phocaeensis]